MTSPQGVQLGSAYGQIVIGNNIDTALTNAQRSFDNALSAIGGRMEQLGNQMSRVGVQLSILTAPITAFGVQGVRAAAAYEDAMKEIEVRAGLTAEQLAMVEQKTRDIGLASQYGPTEAANAFLQLLTSGSSVEEAMIQIDAVIQGASASGSNLAYVADALTDIMAAMGLEAHESANVMQTLINATGASSATFTDLVQGFQNIGPMAANMGLSVEETAAALAVFSENGIKGAEAGTQLRSMLTNMTRDTDDVNAMWERLGISMYDAEGNMRNLDDIIDDLNVAMDGMSDEERNAVITTLAGSYGQLGLSALLASGGIDEMQASMDGQADISDVAASRLDTFNGAIEFLRGSIELLQIEALGPLMDEYLRPMVERIAEVVNSVRDWIVANPELAGQIVQVLAVIAALGPVLVVVGTAMSALAPVISGIGLLLGGLFSPIGLVIAAVGALAAAYMTNFGGIRDFIDNTIFPALRTFFGWLGGVWTDIVQPALSALYDWFITSGLPAISDFLQNTALPAIQSFFGWIGDIWTAVQPGLASLYDWFITSGLPAIQTFVEQTVIPALQGFSDLLAGIWGVVEPALQPLADWFVDAAGQGLVGVQAFLEGDWATTWDVFSGMLSGLWDATSQGLQSVADWFVTDGLGGIDAWLTDTFPETWSGFREMLAGLWDFVQPGIQAFQSGIEGAMSAVSTVIGGIADAIRDVAQALGVVQSDSQAIASTAASQSSSEAAMTPPGFAAGINVLPQDMLIQAHQGEAIIPAAFNPYNPEAQQAGAGGGMGGGINVTIGNITASGRAEGQAAGDAFGEQLMLKLREGGWNG